MKRMKRILTLCLVFCLTLAMIPAVPAQALTLQEQSWLEYLRPDVPKLEGRSPYLTYDRMGAYIACQDNAAELMAQLHKVIEEARGQKNPRGFVDDWFRKTLFI